MAKEAATGRNGGGPNTSTRIFDLCPKCGDYVTGGASKESIETLLLSLFFFHGLPLYIY